MKKTPKRPETINQVRVARFWRRMKFDVEATQVIQLRSDGTLEGAGSGKTLYIPRLPLDAPTPGFMLLSMWLLVAVMSLYAAKEVRGFVLHDDELIKQSWLVSTVNGLETIAQTLGATVLREHIDGVMAPLKNKTDEEAWLMATAEKSSSASLKAPEPFVPTKSVGAAEQATSTTRILLVGASSMEFYLGAELERRLETYRGINVHRFGKLGTGLARPDEFDWPKQVEILLRSFKPHLVIAQFGGNDGQPMTSKSGKALPFGSDGWEKEYVARIQRILQLTNNANAKMVMLGMPITRHPKHSEKLKKINEITKRTTEAAGGSFIPTWDIAVDEKGQARESIRYDGKTGAMYLADGVHFARVGAAMVANRLAFRLERLLALVPQNMKLAAARPLEMVSEVRNTKVSYLAFVPQSLVPKEKVPAVLLLHGAQSSPVDFSEQAHELLQQLAEKHRVVLVAPDCDPDGWYVNSPLLANSQIETFLMNEFLPEIREKLPISNRLGVIGISMGGNGALVLSMKHPGTFLSVSSMSGAIDLSFASNRPALIERLGPYAENNILWEDNSALHRVQNKQMGASVAQLMLTVGTKDRWWPANRALRDALRKAEVAHTYQEYDAEHAWAHWVAILPTHIQFHAQILRPDLKLLPESAQQTEP